mmetsp:Transcript_6383/g.19363  ORF Transcript_6383/g.19363 Transcript_6383/m.19363 type:complete len:391 (+) Transcript_6383:109-1281(+)
MFVDNPHKDANEKGLAKPYSGPTGVKGWVRNLGKYALTHHHSESLIPHVVFPIWIWVKVLGPVNAVFVGSGLGNFVRSISRGLALSLCYIMHADWYNDCCDIDIDAKNKPSRPLPSGKCSLSQGLAISALYPVLGGVVLAWIQRTSSAEVSRAYALAFVIMTVSAFLYSDNNLPTRAIFRESALGRLLTFCGIYVGFDLLCYTDVCDGLGLDPLDRRNPLATAFIAYSVTNFWFNTALLMTKDLGDIAGDRASGLSTIPVVLGTEKRGVTCLLAIFATYRLFHIYFHLAGYFTQTYYGLPLHYLAVAVDVAYLAYYAHQYHSVVLGAAEPPETPASNFREEFKEQVPPKSGGVNLKPVVKFYMKHFAELTIGTQFDLLKPDIFPRLLLAN